MNRALRSHLTHSITRIFHKRNISPLFFSFSFPKIVTSQTIVDFYIFLVSKYLDIIILNDENNICIK